MDGKQQFVFILITLSGMSLINNYVQLFSYSCILSHISKKVVTFDKDKVSTRFIAILITMSKSLIKPPH